MRLSFRKMHGAGNDFLVIDQRGNRFDAPSPEKIRRLADRRKGVGFDQLMWIGAPRDPASLAYYRVFNADGSEVEQCGNGVRCVAWVIARESEGRHEFTLDSPSGAVPVRILGDDSIAVSMGQPILEPDDIPFRADKRHTVYPLEVGGSTLTVSVVSMGNPHCILEVADVADAAVGTLGPMIETHERFPSRTNVGFMAIRNRDEIELRVHERGVGETMACGTGACAAVVAGRLLDRLDEKVRVHLPGGQLMVSWRGETAPVWLSGNAELSYEGIVEL